MSLAERNQASYLDFIIDWYEKNRYIRYTAPDLVIDQCRYQVEHDLAFVTITVPQAAAKLFRRDISATFQEKVGAFGERS